MRGRTRGRQESGIRRFKRAFQADLLLAVREQERELIITSRALLAIMKRNLGRWELDSMGMVVFDASVPDEDVHPIDALVGRIGVAMERLEEVQRGLFDLDGR